MPKAVRLLAVAGVLILIAPAPALLPALLGSGSACASAAGAGRAALVVDTGSQTLRICVSLDSASVTGLHLIELAHAQHGLQYRLGFGGLAVCQLAGVGANGSDCFASYPDFWGLWIGSGSGGWTWSGSGAGSSSVGNGGIQAWSWGSGDSGLTHPRPPGATEVSICGSSVPSPQPAAHTPALAVATPTPSIAPAKSASVTPKRSRAPSGAPTSASLSPTPDASVGPLAAGPYDGPGSGSPAGLLVGLAGVVALGFAGWMRTRRRGAKPSSR